MWKKIADGSTPNYKCYKSTNSTKTALQNLWNQYQKLRQVYVQIGNAAKKR